MFILKIVIALAVALFMLYNVASFLFTLAQFFNIIRHGDDALDEFPVIKMIIASISILACFLVWKSMF